MIDIVIPLNAKSLWQDNELRFALRSIEKYLTNYRNIYIIGKKPLSIGNVIHVSSSDQHKYPARNIYMKILKACAIDDISEDFLFMNDDHFFLQPFDAEKIPFYYKGYLRDDLYNKTDYMHTVENTIKALMATHPTKNFDIHTPIIYNKKKFVEALDVYDWEIPHAYAIKSLYCNSLNIEGVFAEDGKIRKSKIIKISDQKMLELFLANKPIFSIDDSALTNAMKKYFELLYPKKSKYEKN